MRRRPSHDDAGPWIYLYGDQRREYIEDMAADAHGFVVRPPRKAVALGAPLVIALAEIDAMLACFTRVLRDTETYARQLQ